MKKLNILIVDDHPIIIEGYKNALKTIEGIEYLFDIRTANSCDSAIKEITQSAELNPIDLLFLDLNLPESSDGKITSGQCIGKFARKLIPDIKVIISTMCTDNFVIHDILKNLSPLGFLIKSDISPETLTEAFDNVNKGTPYYSNSIVRYLRMHLTNDLDLDDIDRKILHLLSKGVSTKSLTSFIPLSLAAIEKRKRNLKDLFGVKRTNGSLIENAIKRGYV
jgi:DNA-binding NarL/FixJ family response regulator